MGTLLGQPEGADEFFASFSLGSGPLTVLPEDLNPGRMPSVGALDPRGTYTFQGKAWNVFFDPASETGRFWLYHSRTDRTLSTARSLRAPKMVFLVERGKFVKNATSKFGVKWVFEDSGFLKNFVRAKTKKKVKITADEQPSPFLDGEVVRLSLKLLMEIGWASRQEECVSKEAFAVDAILRDVERVREAVAQEKKAGFRLLRVNTDGSMNSSFPTTPQLQNELMQCESELGLLDAAAKDTTALRAHASRVRGVLSVRAIAHKSAAKLLESRFRVPLSESQLMEVQWASQKESLFVEDFLRQALARGVDRVRILLAAEHGEGNEELKRRARVEGKAKKRKRT
jgi:hypothetical protein